MQGPENELKKLELLGICICLCDGVWIGPLSVTLWVREGMRGRANLPHDLPLPPSLSTALVSQMKLAPQGMDKLMATLDYLQQEVRCGLHGLGTLAWTFLTGVSHWEAAC